MDAGPELQRRQCGRKYVNQSQHGVIVHEMTSAFLAILPLAH
jgi:hypothetical protein